MNTSYLLDYTPLAEDLSLAASNARPTPGEFGTYRTVVRHRTDTVGELADLRRGLLDATAHIDPKFFYDPRGCELFDEICALPEYYLTRTEAAIFERHRAEIIGHLPRTMQWIDLGCGSGDKSELWIGITRPQRFIGVDIAREWLDMAVRRIAGRFPHMESLGVVADFSDHLAIHDIIDEQGDSEPVFFYPGSSLGNLPHARALAFLRSLRGHLGSGGCLLIGVDLVKDRRILEAAYNDTQGVTAAFNRNVLHVVNRKLEAGFDPDLFDHHARFDQEQGRVEMRLRSTVLQRVIVGADTRIFAKDEDILTEHSHKYTRDGFAAMLSAAGYSQQTSWVDPAGWYAVFIARP